MFSSPGTFVILVKAQFEVLQPLDLLVAVVFRLFRADDVLDNDAAVFVELIAPVAVVAVAEVDQILNGVGLLGRLCDFLDRGGGHGV